MFAYGDPKKAQKSKQKIYLKTSVENFKWDTNIFQVTQKKSGKGKREHKTDKKERKKK